MQAVKVDHAWIIIVAYFQSEQHGFAVRTWSLHHDPVRALRGNAAQKAGGERRRRRHDGQQLLVAHETCVIEIPLHGSF